MKAYAIRLIFTGSGLSGAASASTSSRTRRGSEEIFTDCARSCIK